MNTSLTNRDLVSEIVHEVVRVNAESSGIVTFLIDQRRFMRFTKSELRIALEQVRRLDGRKIASQFIGCGPLRLELI